jgi:hypothetical protein
VALSSAVLVMAPCVLVLVVVEKSEVVGIACGGQSHGGDNTTDCTFSAHADSFAYANAVAVLILSITMRGRWRQMMSALSVDH